MQRLSYSYKLLLHSSVTANISQLLCCSASWLQRLAHFEMFRLIGHLYKVVSTKPHPILSPEEEKKTAALKRWSGNKMEYR